MEALVWVKCYGRPFRINNPKTNCPLALIEGLTNRIIRNVRFYEINLGIWVPFSEIGAIEFRKTIG